MDTTEQKNEAELVARIVAAFVSNNSVPVDDVARLVRETRSALFGPATPLQPSPAIASETTITDDYLICLEDGKKFKSLKRHLRSHYNMSPEEYRRKWGLPGDYPMVAPNYAKTRSDLAKKMGLGFRTKNVDDEDDPE